MATKLVKIGKVPGTIKEFALDNGANVATALEMAEMDAAGYEIRVNGAEMGMSGALSDGDVVLLLKKIKGN